ncbi:hypothetical protein [Streptomyces sp. BBFR102]|uniref:hypothetical protein n=1 Tax=Streptomyces sp. BBFR102 TaxID=3448171 RepID=UPI003F52966D
MADLEHVVPDTPERVPLDIGAARAAADEALSLQLGTTTRVRIEAMTERLTGQIKSALAELPRDAPGRPRPTREEAAALLAAARTGAALAYTAYGAMRDLAFVLRHLAGRCEAERAAQGAPGAELAPGSPTRR